MDFRISERSTSKECLVLIRTAKEGLFFTKNVLRAPEKTFIERTLKQLSSDPHPGRVIASRTGKPVIVITRKKKSPSVRELRKEFRSLIALARKEKISHLTIPLENTSTSAVELIAIECTVAHFKYTEYKTKKVPEKTPLSVTLTGKFTKDEKRAIQAALVSGKIIGNAINATRRLSNTPGGDMTPSVLEAESKIVAKRAKISCKVLNVRDMEKLGMGGVLGVGKGSVDKPKFIILDYAPKGAANAKTPLVLVGKGVTFDTGGLNLKPSGHIYEMHMDMSGGAAVIHAIEAIAQLELPLRVVGLIPAVENMPSGESYRPGDILKSLSGKTIEILNTDAEGRVILADALEYAKRYNPQFVLDIATLTGGAVAALGVHASALFTKKPSDESLLRELGESSGDYVWPLPMWDEYAEDLIGTFADTSNVAKNKSGGDCVFAAKFLEQFTNYPWAHLDIAPTMTTNKSDKLAGGAKGSGVRLSVALARHFATSSKNLEQEK